MKWHFLMILIVGLGVPLCLFPKKNNAKEHVTITIDDDEEILEQLGLSEDILEQDDEIAYDKVCDEIVYEQPSMPIIWLRSVGSTLVASFLTSKRYLSQALVSIKNKIRNMYS